MSHSQETARLLVRLLELSPACYGGACTNLCDLGGDRKEY